jgi:hypothetical protein
MMCGEQERRMTQEKNHQNRQWLEEQVNLGKTSKEIANESRISYKLVELYLRQYDIPFQKWVK